MACIQNVLNSQKTDKRISNYQIKYSKFYFVTSVEMYGES